MIESQGTRLSAWLARPTSPGARVGVVVCHGFPTGPRGAAASASTFSELADRIARERGLPALSFNFRGTGSSDGSFSGAGWLEDVRSAVSACLDLGGVDGACVVGVGEGGTLALCAAEHDDRVRAVATLGAPVSLRDWARDPARLLAYARRAGLVRDETLPPNVANWAREFADLDAAAAVGHGVPPTVLVVHGLDDPVVPASAARAIAAAAGDRAELHLLAAGGHELRHDPRAIATLLGWLERIA
jgi:putative redox protein